ncbi:MAG: hypothetical protein ABSG12_02860 [Steroidobacteraceae bacterium]|jgi:hypothetical protein
MNDTEATAADASPRAERLDLLVYRVKTALAAVITAVQCLDGRGVVDTALADTLRAAAIRELNNVLEELQS